MERNGIWRWIRISLLAASACVALASIAWGQDWRGYDRDNYSYNRDEARERGYRGGYHDGLRAGHYDAERGRRFKFKNDDWEDSRGYEHWMGNHGRYKKAYRRGYEDAYRRSFSSFGYRRDWDRDDYRRHEQDWHDRDWHDRD